MRHGRVAIILIAVVGSGAALLLFRRNGGNVARGSAGGTPQHRKESAPLEKFTVALGDQVEVSGWRLQGAVVANDPVMLAVTIRKGGRELRLRDDERRALWATN